MKELTGEDRYTSKRLAGISDIRKDGSKTNAENDRQSAAAEKFSAEFCDCKYNDEISLNGDGGFDFIFPLAIDVVWMGFYSGTNEPRENGHLIINPDEPKRWSDIYIVVKGSIEDGFRIAGWTTHKALIGLDKKDFGYGPKFAMPVEQLEPIERLLAVRVVSMREIVS